MTLALHGEFIEILEPLGQGAGDFFLAAALYHARKISFLAAAKLAGLEFEDFAARLREHFGTGYWLGDEVVREDIQTVRALRKP
jgi:predicted HTH domain antitoxin